MAISKPPMMSTCDVVGVVIAFTRVPYLKGASTTIAANGAESSRKRQIDVVATTRIPAIFSAAHTATTDTPTNNPSVVDSKPGKQARQVKHKQRRVDGHIEDAGH